MTSTVPSSRSSGTTPTDHACSSCRRSAHPTEAFEVAAETRAFLAGHGIDLTAEQQTKTKKALEFFAGELRDTGTVRR